LECLVHTKLAHVAVSLGNSVRHGSKRYFHTVPEGTMLTASSITS